MNDYDSLNSRLQSALTLLQHEQDARAEAVLREAIVANPGQAHANLIQYAATLFDHRHYRQAITALQAVLTIEPDQYAVHFNLGMALALNGDDEEAVRAYRKSIELAPGFTPAHMNLAAIYYRRKAYEAARELTEKVIAMEPDGAFTVQAYCNLYDVYQKLHYSRDVCFAQLQKAMEACQGRPKEPLLYLNLASYYELTHDLKSCRRTLQTALRQFPDCDQAKYLLAVCCRHEKNYPEAIKLLSLCEPRKFQPDELAGIHFEFGKCLHEMKAYEQAFEHLTKANRIAQSIHGHQPSHTLARARNHCRALSARWDLRTDRSTAPDPVFLIGFPRSGTTLLEQILDSHPQITTLEEKPVTRALVRELVKINPTNLMAAIDTLDKGGLQTLRDLYLQTRQKYVSRPDSTLIIDKLPLSTINLPVLYRLFPKSRFIFAIRHPLDCLLSCYMQNFGPNDAMSNFYNLDDAAELYVNSMGIWKKSLEYLQLRYHAVRYEDLVENLERESRALLGFLQLHWDSRVLQYHIHARKAEFINTPSYAQVTQPIYSGARYRWKNYTRQLSGTKAKVQSFIEFFGYEP